MQVSAGPFDANSLSSGPWLSTLPPVHRQYQSQSPHAHSTSLSSDSLATIRHTGSLPRARSRSSVDDAPPSPPSPLGRRSLSPSDDHRRRRSVALDPSELAAGTSTAAEAASAPTAKHNGQAHRRSLSILNRWSHSTSSSIASLTTTIATPRNRSSSDAVLTSLADPQYPPPRNSSRATDASPRRSPQRRAVTSSHASPKSSPERRRPRTRPESHLVSLTALPPLYSTPALTDPNDTESASATQTLPTTLGTSYVQHEYFDHAAPYGVAKTTKRVITVRNPAASMTVPRPSVREPPGESQSRTEMEYRMKPTPPEAYGGRRPRNRDRAEKDKKTMLSKALQKANTAVLLDNAQNYEGALEAYGDACDLLTQVMERTLGEDDKRKLDAIRVTYSNRMEELRLLAQERPLTSDEKDLPARPISADGISVQAASRSPLDDLVDGGVSVKTPREEGNAPRLSYRHNDRDSFFTRTMQAVESSTRFSGPGEASSVQSPAVVAGAQEPWEVRRVHIPPPEHAQYVPRPLSPKRPSLPSPKLPPEDSWQHLPEQPREPPRHASARAPNDSISWLDALDDSGASSYSVDEPSRDSIQDMRATHFREQGDEMDLDFDEAFDAAVEAAYDEGLEPDLEARRKRLSAQRRVLRESTQVPASEIEEILPGSFPPSDVLLNTDPGDEEEERILDEITNDFGRGFNFDLSSKSALPRQSDSSGYSRSTWQSSQLSSRDTAATLLSTVTEDALTGRASQVATVRDSAALPAATAPPLAPLPRSSSSGPSRGSKVRSRRLSGMNAKQLKIETAAAQPENRKRASTFNHHYSAPLSEYASVQDPKGGDGVDSVAPDSLYENMLLSPSTPGDMHGAADSSYGPSMTLDHRPSYEELTDLPSGTKPTLFRKNRSTVSLRDHTVLLASPDPEAHLATATPMSSSFTTFAAKRNHTQNPLTSQRAAFASLGQGLYDQQFGGGIHLFDTSLSVGQDPLSPRSPTSQPQPAGLEPCPQSFLLRPFWLMRVLASTIVHPRGGFLTEKLFVSRQVWQTRGVKLKLVEDKVANCDLLTAALGRLAGVDTFDADAVMEELQNFEEVMDKVSSTLAKKLGNDVGGHRDGVAAMFKDASSAIVASTVGSAASEATAGTDKGAKSNSGKSWSSWGRKLRNKSSGTPLSGGLQTNTAANGVVTEQHTMSSVPMTSFVPVERRGNKRDARNLVFEGPSKEYMGSLVRLFDGVQILDQIARQVEDPGLKHSSPTHVGLELSIRHAAEFFGFYVCRFVLADLALLMDKHVKRGSEWVLA